jgi:uncharacterized membrane protein YphA (DoxX/SURF4 family)
MKFNSKMLLAVRLFMALIFAHAAVAKIFDANSPRTSPTIFSTLSTSSPMRWAVIGTEILLAVWLISGIETNAAGAVAIAILSGFSGVVLVELTKNNPLPCGCTGASKALMDTYSIRRSLQFDLMHDLLMMGAASFLLMLPRNSKVGLKISYRGSEVHDCSANPL